MIKKCVICHKTIHGRFVYHARLNMSWCAGHNYDEIEAVVGEDVRNQTVLIGTQLV